MKSNLFLALTARTSLFLLAFFAGFSFWALIKNTQIGKLAIDLPVYVILNSGRISIKKNNTIPVTLLGPRSLLASLNKAALGFYLNSSALSVGENRLTLTKQHLMLPSQIELSGNGHIITTLVVEEKG